VFPADKEGLYAFTADFKTFEFKTELLIESLHICFTCIELVDIGIETAIVTFGVTIRDMDVG